MNVWAKMVTALRGGINEAGEAIVDTQALRILDQEIRDASDELNGSKNALADIMARHKLSDDKAAQLENHISEHEGYALKALDKNDETLANEVAQKIASLEDQLATEQQTGSEFKDSAQRLRDAVNQAEHNIRHLKQQVDTVKAVDNVQRAQAAVAERFSGTNSKLRTAMDSLQRIKEKHALQGAKISAARELASDDPDTSLSRKLQAAGIVPKGKQASEVLARLKARHESAS
ncbi:MAG: phage shock protein A [Gammaproteobacteria bacterium]|jgi:phage shock protein A